MAWKISLLFSIPETVQVVRDVMHVGEGVPDPLYLRKARQNRLTHQPQSILHRRTVVIREGRKGLVVYAPPQPIEVRVGRVVPPSCGHDGSEDAVVRIWERRVLVSEETFQPELVVLST